MTRSVGKTLNPNQMSVPSSRRRFQFRLRTLLIGVTLLAVPCAYVGWQAKIVRERQAWLMANPQSGASAVYGVLATLAFGNTKNRPSFVRLWLGDAAQETVELDSYATDEEKQLAIMLFPEARVLLIDWPL